MRISIAPIRFGHDDQFTLAFAVSPSGRWLPLKSGDGAPWSGAPPLCFDEEHRQFGSTYSGRPSTAMSCRNFTYMLP